MLLTASLYACEKNVRWLSPEDNPEHCNDENGKTNSQVDQCKQFDQCKPPVNPVPENTEALCKYGVDSDNNQKSDWQEESCKQFNHCLPQENPDPEDTEELCKDGIDNNHHTSLKID